MELKFEPYYAVADDPDFEHLVFLFGALVPVAHIKIIGAVVPNIGEMEIEDGRFIPLWGFPVMLTDSNYDEEPRDNRQILFDGWETQEEAELQRRNLAVQVDNYYKKLLAGK